MMHAEYLERRAVTPCSDPASRRAYPVPAGDDAMAFLQALHGSLEPEEVLRRFHGHAQRFIPHDGVLVETDSGTWVAGRRAGRRSAAAVELDGRRFGKVTLLHPKALGEGAGAALSALTRLLAQPLWNALRYRDALNAGRRDPLTGLPNRAAFDEALAAEIDLARRYGSPLSLVVVDADRFKEVNDRYGHLAGDQLLTVIARRLRGAERESDLTYRYAGDEFVTILRYADAAVATKVAERMRERVAATDVVLDQGVQAKLRITAGAATLKPGDDARELFRRADQAMFAVKARR